MNGPVTETEAKLIAQKVFREEQDRCPVLQSVAELKNEAERMRIGTAKAMREANDIANRMVCSLAEMRVEIGHIRRQAEHSDEAVRRNTDAILAESKERRTEINKVHGRITSLIWWIVGIEAAIIAAAIGIAWETIKRKIMS